MIDLDELEKTVNEATKAKTLHSEETPCWGALRDLQKLATPETILTLIQRVREAEAYKVYYDRIFEKSIVVKDEEYSEMIDERDELREKLNRAKQLIEANNVYTKESTEKLEVARKSLKKLMYGPGLSLVSWKNTWTHSVCKETLARLEGKEG